MFYKYYPPAKANYSLRSEIKNLINYYKIPSRKINDIEDNDEYIIGTSIIKDKSYPNNQQKLVIHQTRLKDIKDKYIQRKIYRNVLLPTLPIGLFLESENKMVSSVWYYVINNNGEVDIIEAFNSFGFLAKHYLLEDKFPIIFGGEILIKRNGNKKILVFNHLSGNYSKPLLDEHDNTISKQTIENRLTRLSKKIFEKHIDFYKNKLWDFRDKWINDVQFEYVSDRAFEILGYPPKIEIDYWCKNYPNQILISKFNKPSILWKVSKSKNLPKRNKNKLIPDEISNLLNLSGFDYLC